MSYVDRIIEKFGGVRAMAGKIGRPPSTIQDWKNSGFVPARQQQNVLDKAREHGIALGTADFFERPGESQDAEAENEETHSPRRAAGGM